MTTIITRLFSDEKSARNAIDRLIFKGVPRRDCDVFSGDVTAEQLAQAKVDDSAIATYAQGLAAGHTVAVVRATFRPLGAAKLTREVLAQHGGIETDGLIEDRYIPDGVQPSSSILRSHRRFLTLRNELSGRGPVTAGFGMRMLKPHRTKRSVISGGKRMSWFWPMPLLSTKPRRKKVMSGGRAISRAFWPMPLLSQTPRGKKVSPGGGAVFSRALGWSTTS